MSGDCFVQEEKQQVLSLNPSIKGLSVLAAPNIY